MISRYGGRREKVWPQTREGAQARRSGGGPAPALAGRPDGERFVASAPEKVVANERAKQADAEAKITAIREQLAALESGK